MCAIEAGKRGRKVAVLEHSDRAGKKILISGGGRCNFTNIHCRPENFISANPHFVKSALARYTPGDFIALVEQHRIPFHEKTLGQLFCDRAARDITDMLETECRKTGVRIFLDCRVVELRHASGFVVKTERAEFRAPALVIATGGLSIPKIGATGFGYNVARQFGLPITECRPALVPLTFQGSDRSAYDGLAGISADVIASVGQHKFREKMLITHRGLSGPAILQISSYWRKNQALSIDLAPDRRLLQLWAEGRFHRDATGAKSLFRELLPVRLADRWLEMHAPNRWDNSALEELDRRLHRWEIRPSGTEGFEKAEVTAGGVDTDALNGKTMEAKNVPGLFFVGEVVDVTGQLGGFNFQWAWASGFCAGQAIGNSSGAS